ncbi:hypothetical protein ACJZ2D_002409 [Fusarium nematophilum]
MRFLAGLLLLGMSLWTAQAYEIGLSEKDGYQKYCTGMYSRSSWGGPVDPFILVKFLNNSQSKVKDPIASLVIYEWKDGKLVGIPDAEYGGNRFGVCDKDFVEQGLCNTTDIGKFILDQDADKKSSTLILTKAVHLNKASPINYSIKKTGFYCVVTQGFKTDKYEAVVEWRNAYGELQATQIPKLPFYGGMTILYALIAAYWGFLYYQHRHDILAVQNYITAILIFLVVEMLMTWGFYDYQNRNGANIGSKVLLTVVGILNAARNSFSFFLLLIVCMGYGVVKPTLGRTMIWVRWLAAAHFLFGLVYSVTSLSITPETAGPFVLLIVLPLAGTLTAFYVWTLNSLNLTLKDLHDDGNFEIGDIGVPGEDSDDEESQVGKPQNSSQAANGLSFSGPSQSATHQGISRTAPRESLENETIFAIGEDGDKFSDDGSDDEDAKLVKAK